MANSKLNQSIEIFVNHRLDQQAENSKYRKAVSQNFELYKKVKSELEALNNSDLLKLFKTYIESEGNQSAVETELCYRRGFQDGFKIAVQVLSED